MYRTYLLTAAVAAALVAGCAPMDNKVADEAPAEKTHITGSRIPVRDSSQSSASVQATENTGGNVPQGAVNIYPKGTH